MRRVFVLLTAFACLFVANGNASAKPPDIVVSIAPLHGLAASIAQGVSEPKLLLPPGATPHSFSLRPSAARALAGADLIVRVGPELENFMERPLKALTRTDRLLTLTQTKGMTLLKARDTHHRDHGHGHDHESSTDPHLWLSPGNARTIATAIATRLAAIDPGRKRAYALNLERTLAGIAKTEQDIAVLLSPVRAAPYATFHDAFQYFERAFALTGGLWVAVDASRRPGAKRLSALRREFSERNVRCVFSEPQFPSSLLQTLTEGTRATIAVLDPLGSKIRSGAGHWNETMLTLARSLRECLSSR